MNQWLPYLIWVPITIFYNWLMCWASVHYGNEHFLRMYVFMLICSAIPTWSLAAYVSHNLVFDGLVYDSTLVLTSPIIFWFLGQGHDFSLITWGGVVMTVGGLTLVRYTTLH